MYKEKPKIKEYSCEGCCFLHEFRKYTAQKKGEKSIFGQYTSRWGVYHLPFHHSVSVWREASSLQRNSNPALF